MTSNLLLNTRIETQIRKVITRAFCISPMSFPLNCGQVLRAAALVSGPTGPWGTASFTDVETATLRQGHANNE